MKRRLPAASWLVMAAFVGVLAAGQMSCQVAGFFIAALEPPKKVKPQYTPPRNTRVLVFVDDRANPTENEPLRRELTERINKHLAAQRLVAEVIPYEQVTILRASRRDFATMNEIQVGRGCNADTVLHVRITDFRLKELDEIPLWDARVAAMVRWLSVKPEDQHAPCLWPTGNTMTQGFSVAAAVPAKEDTAESFGVLLTQQLTERMADTIVKLFYEHEVAP